MELMHGKELPVSASLPSSSRSLDATQEGKRSSYLFAVCQIGAFHKSSGKTPTNTDSLSDHLAEIGITSICASTYTSPLPRVFDMMCTLLQNQSRYRVVLLHVYSGRAFLWAFLTTMVAKLLRKKLVLWLHGGNLPAYYTRHKALVELVFRRADHVFAPSAYLAQTFSAKFKVAILPYELPIETYPHRVRTSLRSKLLWLRTFNAGYNPTMAPHVIKLLAQDYPDVELLMCGPDSGDGSFQATQQLAQELGVEDHISFPGKISKDRIKKVGLDYDVFINTTNYDNNPVSVIEAMAMGMCVVSTNVGGVPYLVSHGQDGLLVPPNDPDSMASACRQLLSDPVLAQRLSRNARHKAESFDWKNLAPKWQALLTSLHTQSGIDAGSN